MESAFDSALVGQMARCVHFDFMDYALVGQSPSQGYSSPFGSLTLNGWSVFCAVEPGDMPAKRRDTEPGRGRD